MKLKVGPFEISAQGPTFVVAEVGVNHNGDVELAKQLVRAAKQAGADAVKFQTFRADRLAMAAAPKAAYQLQTTNPHESQLEMLRSLELPPDGYQQLAQLCQSLQLVFLSTPYNHQDVDFLESLGVVAYKIASGQAVEPLFLEHVAQKGKPVLLSTGMCTLGEARHAVQTIRQTGNDQVMVLQCTTNYPSAVSDAHLLAMVTLGRELDVPVGYSDHTQSLTAATVAVALGACVIERHLTLDKTQAGPDHACSSDPQEFALLVKTVREAKQAMGSPVKKPTHAEQQNIHTVRRGVVAARPIPAGTELTQANLALKRPLSFFAGADLPKLIGRQAAVDIEPDTPLAPEMIR